MSVSLALVAAVQQAGAQDARAQNAGARSAGATGAVADSARGRCTAREIGRSTLRADSLELYVEPSVLSVSGDEMLLAGKPVYAWRRTSTGAAEYVERDDILGAVIARDGSARIVTAPVAHGDRLMGLRAAPHRGGGWDVVFAELSAPYDIHRDTTVAKLWHGVFRGSRWHDLTLLPLPAAIAPDPFDASELLQVGDTLMWAMSGTTADEPNTARRVLVFSRTNRRWSREVVETGTVARVDVIHPDHEGFLLVVPQPDTRALRPGKSIQGSVMVYGRRNGWVLLGRAVDGDSLNAFLRSAATDGDRAMLTWFVQVATPVEHRREARALVSRAVLPDPPWTVIDPDINYIATPVVVSGAPVWVTEHLVPTLLEPSSELRLIALDRSSTATELMRVPNPYRGFFAAATPAPEELWIAGPVPGRTSADPVVVTLLVRVRIECRRDMR